MRNILLKEIKTEYISKLYILWSIIIIATIVNVSVELVSAEYFFKPFDSLFMLLGITAWASAPFHSFITCVLLLKLFFSKHVMQTHRKTALVYAGFAMFSYAYLIIMLTTAFS